jgi:phosphoserine aminotransferase
MYETSHYNFAAGPATLPREVMLQAQEEFVNYKGIGHGLMEESHRGASFMGVMEQTEATIRELMGISDEYSVLFLQGGASTQFAMIPMNLAVEGKPILYADTGVWASKAIKEAKLFSEVKEVYSGKAGNYSKIGDPGDWEIPADAAYMGICSNNTIFGTEYRSYPVTGDVPLVADMSSDIMSRNVDVNKFGLIFAGAQKNLGPAGVTLVIIRKDLAERTPERIPTIFKYKTHMAGGSMFNTPPTFAIYMVGLVAQWIKKQGGVAAIDRINGIKSSNLYQRIDDTDFYRGTAEPADRSRMNVCFRLPSEELEAKFLKEATAAGLTGLKGHRSVGGLRASIYNAMPLAGVSRLIDFMNDFETNNG